MKKNVINIWAISTLLTISTIGWADDTYLIGSYGNGISHLQKARVLATTIKDKNLKERVVSYLQAQRKLFEKDYADRDFFALNNRASTLLKYIKELIAECEDEVLKKLIYYNLQTMIEAFEAVASGIEQIIELQHP